MAIRSGPTCDEPSQVKFADLLRLLNISGYFFIFAPILLALRGFRAAHRHSANKTRRVITVETLPWVMSNHSPAIIPSLYYGDPHTLLLNDDPPEHRSAIHPEEWALQHGLIVNRRLDRERCRELLVKDLGSPIKSLNELSVTERALFAVFGARLLSDGRDMKKAQELLDALNRSCHHNTHEGKKAIPT